MPKHRYTFEFVSTAGNPATAGAQVGWTESWFDPVEATTDVARLKAVTLKNFRRDMLTPGWSITAIRISQLDASFNLLRKGVLIQLPPNGNAGSYLLAEQNYDEQPWDAINISIQTVGGSRRAFLMRGIARGVIAASGRFTNPAAWRVAFPEFVRGLSGVAAGGVPPGPAAFALRVRSAPQLTALSDVRYVAITGVNFVVDATRPAVRVKINTVQAGMTVSISGIDKMSGVNGQWRVQAMQIDPTDANYAWVSLLPRRRNVVSGVYVGGGTVRFWNWFLDPIIGATAGNGASRRTGRPTQALRGRRSVRRS